MPGLPLSNKPGGVDDSTFLNLKQNLHEKAISILENLYQATGKEDDSIKLKISQIIASKPGLRSKVQ
jgi:hypothetical protein